MPCKMVLCRNTTSKTNRRHLGRQGRVLSLVRGAYLAMAFSDADDHSRTKVSHRPISFSLT